MKNTPGQLMFVRKCIRHKTPVVLPGFTVFFNEQQDEVVLPFGESFLMLEYKKFLQAKQHITYVKNVNLYQMKILWQNQILFSEFMSNSKFNKLFVCSQEWFKNYHKKYDEFIANGMMKNIWLQHNVAYKLNYYE